MRVGSDDFRVTMLVPPSNPIPILYRSDPHRVVVDTEVNGMNYQEKIRDGGIGQLGT